MADARILIVEDDDLMRDFLNEALSDRGYDLIQAVDAEEGLEQFKERDPDLVLADVKMPGRSGLDMLKDIRELDQRIPVVMITAYAETDTAIKALRNMASDFVKKPFEAPEIVEVIEQQLQGDEQAERVIDDFKPIYSSDAMARIIDQARTIANEGDPVLIEGESGVGKEVIARFIHYQSPRRDHPMVSINCGAIPKQLLESELFGHTKGAFTGAEESREGLFLAADGGSLFLDEIAEMPLELQSKLLRVLEQHQIKPVGSDRTREVDVRIIAASNQDISAQVESGDFREDLFYRLNVFNVTIPPLRDRSSDVGPLIDHFMEKFSIDHELSKSIRSQLKDYAWPGNVRQLQNFVRRLKTASPEEVIETMNLRRVDSAGTAPDGLGSSMSFPPEEDLSEVIDTVKSRYIKRALRESEGNKSEAARLLGMNRTTLIETMKRLNINSEDDD